MQYYIILSGWNHTHQLIFYTVPLSIFSCTFLFLNALKPLHISMYSFSSCPSLSDSSNHIQWCFGLRQRRASMNSTIKVCLTLMPHSVDRSVLLTSEARHPNHLNWIALTSFVSKRHSWTNSSNYLLQSKSTTVADKSKENFVRASIAESTILNHYISRIWLELVYTKQSLINEGT